MSTTATYYIKTATDDVRNAMTKLENHIAEAGQSQTNNQGAAESPAAGSPSMWAAKCPRLDLPSTKNVRQ